MKTMNERLRGYRKDLGLSQEYIAKQLKVSRTTITSIEAGERKVNAEELNNFSRVFGVTIDEIVNDVKVNDPEIKYFTRAFDSLSKHDKEEIMNLIDFKQRYKESL